MSGFLIVLMKVVIEATLFRSRDFDELRELGFDQVDLIGFGMDVGNDGEL